MCDTIDGHYTVTNLGDAPSGMYITYVRYKDAKWGWHDFGAFPQPSLMPGQSYTASCGGKLRRCPGDDVTVGFSVNADYDHKIQEKNENNNTDEKLYPSFDQLKQIPRTFKKTN